MSSVHSHSVHTESSAEQIQSDPSSSPSVETKLGLEKSFSEVSQSAASIEGPALGSADAQSEKSSSPTQFYRRRALQLLGIGGAAFAGVFSSRLASFWNSTAPLSQRSKGKGTGPWWLLSPLSAGMSVGYGWKLESLSSVHDGAVVLELAKHELRRSHELTLLA